MEGGTLRKSLGQTLGREGVLGPERRCGFFGGCAWSGGKSSRIVELSPNSS